MAEDHPMAGASPPASPAIEAAVSTIDSYPQHGDDALTSSTLPADAPNSDVPLSIPPTRSPSPALPSLRHVPFPPDEADNSDSDDDEVLYKLPVYMSAGLFPQVQLFQYPMNTRPIAAPEWAVKRGKNVSARVKAEAGKVEVEVPIYGEVNAWRHERAKELSFEQDTHALNGRNGDGEGIVGGARDKRGATGKKDKKPEVKWGDKVRLTSDPVPKATGYYTGQVYDGESPCSSCSSAAGQFRNDRLMLLLVFFGRPEWTALTNRSAAFTSHIQNQPVQDLPRVPGRYGHEGQDGKAGGR